MCKHEPADDKDTGQTQCKKCGKLLLLCKRVNGKPILKSMGGGVEMKVLRCECGKVVHGGRETANHRKDCGKSFKFVSNRR